MVPRSEGQARDLTGTRVGPPGFETDGQQEIPCEIGQFEAAEGRWRQAGDKAEALNSNPGAPWERPRVLAIETHRRAFGTTPSPLAPRLGAMWSLFSLRLD